MSKRNFTLLIIVLLIVIIAVLGFLYFNQSTINTTGNNSGSTNFFSQFNPFTSSKKTTPPVVTPPVNVSGYQPPVVENVKLKEVSSMPIAGYTVFGLERLKAVPVATATPTPDLTTPPLTKKTKITKTPAPLTEIVSALRYATRATGNIYETFADTITEKQYTSTIIPKVYDAYFGNNGNGVVMRYLQANGETIETFLGNLQKEVFSANTNANTNVPSELKGSLLANNIESISVSPDNGSVFYLFNTGNSDTVGTILSLATGKKAQIFDSPFNEWTSFWPNSKMITLTTKPASSVGGYMYAMDQNGKNFDQILGNINGLTTETSPSGKLVLYADNNLTLSIYNTGTNTTTLMGVKTLPEKCVWGSGSDVIYCAVPKSLDGNQPYPDAWYQGEISFSDAIWKIDAKTGNATELVDPAAIGTGEDIDGIKLMLDNSGNYLFFVNKKDSYLWEFNLK